MEREIRDLIRQMSSANPLWGAPRIHGELLKLGIEVSQATVAKYMVRRRGIPSQNWRTFLRNQAEGIAAIDMFVVASASFQLLYVMIILAHDRRKIVRTAITEHPTAVWLSRQITEAFPWDTAPLYLLRDRDASYGSYFCNRVEAMGSKEVVTASRSPWQNAYVERVIGSIRRECLDHILIFTSAPRPVLVCRLLPTHPYASVARQRLPRLPPDPVTHARKSRRHPAGRRSASPLRTSRRLIPPEFLLTNGCVAVPRPLVDDLWAHVLTLDQRGTMLTFRLQPTRNSRELLKPRFR